MKYINVVLASLLLIQAVPLIPKPNVPDTQDPDELLAEESGFCTKEPLGGWWVIGPDGSIAYSPKSCLDAMAIDNYLKAPYHTWHTGRQTSKTRI